MPHPTTPVRLISIGAAIGIASLVALIALSAREMSLAAGLRELVSTRWGITTLVDLYFGLICIGAWICWRERSLPRGAAWCIGLALLGNLVTLVYLLWSARRARCVADLLGVSARPAGR